METRIRFWIELSGAAREAFLNHPTWFPEPNHVVQHYLLPLFQRNLPYKQFVLASERPASFPTAPDAYVERSGGLVTVTKPLPSILISSAGLPGQRDEARAIHLRLVFQSPGGKAAASERSTFLIGVDEQDPGTAARSDLYKTAEHKDDDQQQIWSDQTQIQVYHDICSLWGKDAKEAPPLLCPTRVTTTVSKIREHGAVDTHALDQVHQRILVPYTRSSKTANRPRACLFYGPPGTGKTEMVLSLCSQVGMRIIWYGTGAEVNSKWVGETEQAILQRFAACREMPNVPNVLIIDEIDTLTTARGGTNNHQEAHRTDWISLMLRLVGSADFPNLLLIGLTNRRAAMDPAFLRHGRFGPAFYFGPLPSSDRWSFIRVLLDKAAIVETSVFDKSWLTRTTTGFTTAMLAECVELCNNQFTNNQEAPRCATNKMVVAAVRAVADKYLEHTFGPRPLLVTADSEDKRAQTNIYLEPPPSVFADISTAFEFPPLTAVQSIHGWWTNRRHRCLMASTSRGVVQVTETTASKNKHLPWSDVVAAYLQNRHAVEFLVVVQPDSTAVSARNEDGAHAAILAAEEQCAHYIHETKSTAMLWIHLDKLLGWQSHDVVSETKGGQVSTQVSPAVTSHSEHWTRSRQSQGQVVRQALVQPLIDLLRRFAHHERLVAVVETDCAELYDLVAQQAGWTVGIVGDGRTTRLDASCITSAIAGAVSIHEEVPYTFAIASDASSTWRTAMTTLIGTEDDSKTTGTRICTVRVERLHKECKLQLGLIATSRKHTEKLNAKAALSDQSATEMVFAAWDVGTGKIHSQFENRPWTAAIQLAPGDKLMLALLPHNNNNDNSKIGTLCAWHNGAFLGHMVAGCPTRSFRWAISLYHPNDHVTLAFDDNDSKDVTSLLTRLPCLPSVQWSTIDVVAGIRALDPLGFVTTRSGWQTIAITTSIRELFPRGFGSIHFQITGQTKGATSLAKIWLGAIPHTPVGHRLARIQHLGQDLDFDGVGVDIQTQRRWAYGQESNLDVGKKIYLAFNLLEQKSNEAGIGEVFTMHLSGSKLHIGVIDKDGKTWHWATLLADLNTSDKLLNKIVWFPAVSVYDEGVCVRVVCVSS